MEAEAVERQRLGDRAERARERRGVRSVLTKRNGPQLSSASGTRPRPSRSIPSSARGAARPTRPGRTSTRYGHWSDSRLPLPSTTTEPRCRQTLRNALRSPSRARVTTTGTSPALAATNVPGSGSSASWPTYCHVPRKIRSCSRRRTSGSVYQLHGRVVSIWCSRYKRGSVGLRTLLVSAVAALLLASTAQPARTSPCGSRPTTPGSRRVDARGDGAVHALQPVARLLRRRRRVRDPLAHPRDAVGPNPRRHLLVVGPGEPDRPTVGDAPRHRRAHAVPLRRTTSSRATATRPSRSCARTSLSPRHVLARTRLSEARRQVRGLRLRRRRRRRRLRRHEPLACRERGPRRVRRPEGLPRLPVLPRAACGLALVCGEQVRVEPRPVRVHDLAGFFFAQHDQPLRRATCGRGPGASGA